LQQTYGQPSHLLITLTTIRSYLHPEPKLVKTASLQENILILQMYTVWYVARKCPTTRALWMHIYNVFMLCRSCYRLFPI